MKIHTYRIILNREPEGGYTVLVPALEGCITYGQDIDQAMTMAQEAIEGYLTMLKDLGKQIPDDSQSLEYTLSVTAE